MAHEQTNSYMIGKTGGWRPMVRVTKEQHDCSHIWEMNGPITPPCDKCKCCGRVTMKKDRMHCSKCLITSCGMCSSNYFDITIPVEREQPIPYKPFALIREQQAYIAWSDNEMERLRQEIKTVKALAALQIESIQKKYEEEKEQLLRERSAERMALDTEIEELKFKADALELENHDLRGQISKQPVPIKDNFEDEEINEDINVLIESKEKVFSVEEVSQPKRKTNGLFNMTVEIDLPGMAKFQVNAILGTGATTCCIDQNSIPKEAIEENTFVVNFSRINSQTKATKKLKNGSMRIGEHSFRIPYTYAFPLTLGGNITMILGCNFIRSGRLRIEGDEVTFYKNVTTIKTHQLTATAPALEELDLEEDEYLHIQEQVNIVEAYQPGTHFKRLLTKLTEAGYEALGTESSQVQIRN